VTTTALTVSAVNAPIRLLGSDGKTHLEYDLILQSMFNAPVTVTSIEVLAPDAHPYSSSTATKSPSSPHRRSPGRLPRWCRPAERWAP
jgi:hypothetical protein